MLRAYFSAERMLTKLGAPARRPSQTFLEHTAALETPLGDASGHLVWLRDAAWAAAYGPQQVSRDVLAEARLRLRALSDAVRALVKTGH